jgi:hypothetical protein
MTLFQRYKRLTLWNKLGVIGSIVGILAFILTVVTLPIPERSKSHPHITFSLHTSDSLTDSVILTNDFLVSNDSFKKPFEILGMVIMPIQAEQSNFYLEFSVTPSDFLEYAEIVVSLPKEWGCVPDSGWEPVVSPAGSPISGAITKLQNGRTNTNDLESFKCQISSIFAGDRQNLPRLLITPYFKNAFMMGIMAKPKNWPIDQIAFETLFVRNPPISFRSGWAFSQKPIVINLTNGNRVTIQAINEPQEIIMRK